MMSPAVMTGPDRREGAGRVLPGRGLRRPCANGLCLNPGSQHLRAGSLRAGPTPPDRSPSPLLRGPTARHRPQNANAPHPMPSARGEGQRLRPLLPIRAWRDGQAVFRKVPQRHGTASLTFRRLGHSIRPAMGPRSARPALHPLPCGKPLGRSRAHRPSRVQPTCRQNCRSTCGLETVCTADDPTTVGHPSGAEAVRPAPLRPISLPPVPLWPATLKPALRPITLRLIPAQPFSSRCAFSCCRALVQPRVARLIPAWADAACSSPSQIIAPLAAQGTVRPPIALPGWPPLLAHGPRPAAVMSERKKRHHNPIPGPSRCFRSQRLEPVRGAPGATSPQFAALPSAVPSACGQGPLLSPPPQALPRPPRRGAADTSRSSCGPRSRISSASPWITADGAPPPSKSQRSAS